MSSADYTSKVPRFEFSDDIDAQEAELESNPLIRRFRESRERLAADPFRPSYHFVSPESTMNDPNGLCFWDGGWHLFYQAYPPEDPRQHWGHAVSTDLVHWRDLPYAIYPNPERCCFSGATLVEEDRVIAMYHGTEAGNMIAVSSDPLLLNWKKIGDGPVIPLPEDASAPGDSSAAAGAPRGSAQHRGSPHIGSPHHDAPYRVFDPCIWRSGTHYYSLSAGYTHHGPSGRRLRADFLFRSKDLLEWEYLHPFVADDIFGLPGDDGACPYFWPIGNRHMLLHYSHMSGGKYILGDYDTDANRLVAAAGGRFNFGAFGPGGVHAPSATPDGAGGLIVIFNMNPAKPTGEWNQIMSLPRRLTLEGDEELRVEPAGDVESLRRSHIHLDERRLPANEELVLHQIVGHSAEIAAVIDPADSPTIELNVLRSEFERTRITLYQQRGFRDWRKYTGREKDRIREARESVVSIDTADSSLAPDVLSRPPESAPVHVPPDEPFDLRIFIDRSVVEVFVNRRQCIAVRVYPSLPDSNGVSLRAHGTDARLLGLDLWQLDTIYGSS